MKKKPFFIISILIFSLLFTTAEGHASGIPGSAETPVGGASLALHEFFIANEEPEEKLITALSLIQENLKASVEMPEAFEYKDDLGALDEETRDTLEYYRKQVNFCLSYDYPEAVKKENAMNQYSILVYLIENYRHIIEIAEGESLTATVDAANGDMEKVEIIRERLTDTTGQTEEDFQEEIQAARAERAEKERLSRGEEIAEYAATFVGTLPYIFGGASLTTGADCSGFCGQILAHFGLIEQWEADTHAYDSRAMRDLGTAVSVSEILPGDLVCYNGHVAIYYGNGMIVHEPKPGRNCEFGDLYVLPVITVRRLW